ncbi:MAG: hypothetical protein ABGW50_05645, partial [Thermococcus sp.]
DAELSEVESKAAKERIKQIEHIKVNLAVAACILAAVGLALNVTVPMIFSALYPRCPALATTHVAAVLVWDAATIYVLRPRLYKSEKRALEAVLHTKRPALTRLPPYQILALPSAGFLLLVLSSCYFLDKPSRALHGHLKWVVTVIIAYHVQMFIPLVSYLTLRLTRTPVLLPCMHLTRFGSGQSTAAERLWEKARGYRPLTPPRAILVGSLTAPTAGMFFFVSLVRLLHIGYSIEGIETIARTAPLVTLGMTPVLTIKARNLLARVPPTVTVESALKALSILAMFVYAVPSFVPLLYHLLP